MSPPVQPEPSVSHRFLAVLPGAARAVLRFAVRPRVFLPAVLLLLLGVVLIEEWRRDPVIDVARTWNRSIERLGLRPIFPPQEDFHVGDVFAVLKLRDDETLEGLTPSQRDLVDKAIRIAHIDLSTDLVQAGAARPRYVTRADELRAVGDAARMPSPGNANRATSPAIPEPAVLRSRSGSELPLRAMMLPGIVMTIDQGFSISGLIGRMTGGAERARAEMIVINRPRTYGFEPAWAAASLHRFCSGSEAGPNPQCTDQLARYLLALQYGRAACAMRGNERLFQVQVFIVTRVYVSQDITVGISQSHAFQLARDRPASAPGADGPAKEVRPDGSFAAETGRTAEPEPGARHAFRLLISQSGRLDAPLAFGFQAATIEALNISDQPRLWKCPEKQ